jgi:hypothetical protein
LAEEIKSSDRSPDCAIVQVDNTPVVYGSFLEAEKQYRGDSHLLAEFKSILKEV